MIVSQFLSWIDSAPAERRAEAAHAMARAYLYSDVAEEDRRDMEAAMTVLLEDPSPDVRFALADALATHPRAPRHVIAQLAADHAEIALKILQQSPAFIDVELIDLVASCDGIRQRAIASRPKLSAAVAAAVAEIGELESGVALLENATAALAPLSLRRIAERFGEEPSIRERLLARSDLPADARQRLIRALADRLQAFVTEREWLGEARARRVTREACERATIHAALDTPPADLAALLEHLRLSGQLNAGLLLRALAFGAVEFFEAGLATLARLPAARVATLLRGSRASALAGIYRKAGLPESALAAFAVALETALRHPAKDVALTVQERFLAMGPAIPGDLMAMIRRFAAEAARDAAMATAERARRAA